MQSRVEADAKEARLKAKLLQEELKKAQKQLRRSEAEEGQLEAEHAQQTACVAAAERELANLGIDEAAIAASEAAVTTHTAAVQHWQRQCRDLASSLGYMIDFKYTDPRSGFDRSTVKGVLARLVRLKNPEEALALEVAAGAKLTNIVVTDESVGALAHSLLKHSASLFRPRYR